MFDFLLQEEWWMETITASCITAIATLIVAALAYGARILLLEKKVDDILNVNNNLQGGHKDLSGEHKNLSREHKELSDKISATQDKLGDRLDLIYLNQEKDKSAREAAGKTMPKESNLVDLIGAIYENHKQLIARNAELEQEVKMLKNQTKQLKNELLQCMQEQTEQPNGWNLDDISGYESKRDDDEWEL